MRRAAGSLFGLAYGDALGAPTEFLSVAQIVEHYGADGPRELIGDPARVTDDTQMALAVAWALHDADGPTPELLEPLLRKRFIDWSLSPDNNRAPGADLPAGLCGVGRRAALGGGHRGRLQGLRRQHAGHSGGPGARLRPGHPGRRRPVAGRADPRSPDGAGGQRADRVRGRGCCCRGESAGRPAAAAARPVPVRAPGLPRAVAGRPVAAGRRRAAGGLLGPRLGRVPDPRSTGSPPRCAAATTGGTRAWPRARAGSRRRRWPPACTARCATATTRSAGWPGRPGPPATPTRSRP